MKTTATISKHFEIIWSTKLPFSAEKKRMAGSSTLPLPDQDPDPVFLKRQVWFRSKIENWFLWGLVH
jgi:hypothetical protein